MIFEKSHVILKKYSSICQIKYRNYNLRASFSYNMALLSIKFTNNSNDNTVIQSKLTMIDIK